MDQDMVGVVGRGTRPPARARASRMTSPNFFPKIFPHFLILKSQLGIIMFSLHLPHTPPHYITPIHPDAFRAELAVSFSVT